MKKDTVRFHPAVSFEIFSDAWELSKIRYTYFLISLTSINGLELIFRPTESPG